MLKFAVIPLLLAPFIQSPEQPQENHCEQDAPESFDPPPVAPEDWCAAAWSCGQWYSASMRAAWIARCRNFDNNYAWLEAEEDRCYREWFACGHSPDCDDEYFECFNGALATYAQLNGYAQSLYTQDEQEATIQFYLCVSAYCD